MELKDLIGRLRDPDPWVRVEALRILAMVEETRALRHIEWVYKNDPEPGVQEIAQWAGKLIWMAARKAEAQANDDTASRQQLQEELFLKHLISNQDSASLTSAMQAQALQHELEQSLRRPKAKTQPLTPRLPSNNPTNNTENPQEKTP